MSMGGDSIDWGDVTFNNSEYQDPMTAESPWGNSALNDFTNLGDYNDSPATLGLRTPSKSGPDIAASTSAPSSAQVPHSASTESSSQDSSSDSSSHRKRKVTSESPMSDTITEKNVPIKTEDSAIGIPEYRRMSNFGLVKTEEPALSMAEYRRMSNLGPSFAPTLPNVSAESSMSDTSEGLFDFQSAASSPSINRDFNQQLSLKAKLSQSAASAAPQFPQESPVQTINPGMFTLQGSRDQSPTNNVMFNTASPTAIFSTLSSDSNETFSATTNWNGGMVQNPTWSAEFATQFTSPGALGFTPSPMANGASGPVTARAIGPSKARSPLHIAPISTKSRVETQINVIMTLEKPPPGIEHLHLPLHTIAKSKLLAKDDYERHTILELHTMLVCTSAMKQKPLKEKALREAAMQNNDEIQRRAELARENHDEEKNDPKNVPEEDKPLNGGEVRICPNCIQRERKRAGRKKLKREEEQQHWERYETERVVVFNSNEYLPFKPCDTSPHSQKESGSGMDEPYVAPDGALCVTAAMRIACYCRHQSEKEGFQVIFTLKDQQGHVVAQQISDSILITDDHKTHPPTTPAVPGEGFYPNSQFPNSSQSLPHSHSMVDLSAHQQAFHSSRSAGNLQALTYGQQFNNSQSHVHSVTQSGFTSQTTSATMTPTTSLSRPGSPTNAGQNGPNKKRKSSTIHRRVPSGLQMTPRVDTSQPPSSTVSSAVSTQMPGTFSPTLTQSQSFSLQSDPSSYMTIPQNNGPAQFFSSGPPTPANEPSQFHFNQSHQLDMARAQNAAAYFSHPSSAVPSRSSSPVLQQVRTNMAAYARQQPIQTPTNSVSRGPNQPAFTTQSLAGAALSEPGRSVTPIITKITPNEGPISGGTEVSVFGYNFTTSTQIMFGETLAPTTFYGSQCLLATSPPSSRPGAVRISMVPPLSQQTFTSPAGQPIFTYKEAMNPQMMEMALRFLSQQQTGDSNRWKQYTNEVATQFMQTTISPGGLQGQGFGVRRNMAASDFEDAILKVLDVVDVGEGLQKQRFDSALADGQIQPLWLWMPFLVAFFSMAMHAVLPYVSPVLTPVGRRLMVS